VKYDPWGNIEEEYNPNDIEQNIRLPGQYCDRETGLYYNYHRYYDPKIGAYINQDPIGLKGGANLYRYAFQNPISLIDPVGLQYSDPSMGSFFGSLAGGTDMLNALSPTPTQSSLTCKKSINCDCAGNLTRCFQLVSMEGPAWTIVNFLLHGAARGPTQGLPDFENPYDENTLNKGCVVLYRRCMTQCFG
jgi:RHS repeat-associated protein